MRLQAEGVLQPRPLMTDVLPFSQAAEAFRLCDETPEQILQIVLKFDQ